MAESQHSDDDDPGRTRLWDAVVAFAESCGGEILRGAVSERRMAAVAAVDAALGAARRDAKRAGFADGLRSAAGIALDHYVLGRLFTLRDLAMQLERLAGKDALAAASRTAEQERADVLAHMAETPWNVHPAVIRDEIAAGKHEGAAARARAKAGT